IAVGTTMMVPNPFKAPVEVKRTSDQSSRRLRMVGLLVLASVGMLASIVLKWIADSSTTSDVPFQRNDVEESSFVESVRTFGRSRGGAHVMNEDGSVTFNEVGRLQGKRSGVEERGDKESPYGLWGALGTRKTKGESP
ncbi:MAG: hypothetical protein AAF802_07990, partial [Planctomycetota bacterium]